MTPWGSVSTGDEMLRFNFKNLEVRLGHLMIIVIAPLSVSESDESDEITTSRKQEIELIEASKP